jgi:hypothetical protein
MKLSKIESEAKKLITTECKRNYNYGGCFTKCRCRINGECAGTTKENKWNIELIEILKSNN